MLHDFSPWGYSMGFGWIWSVAILLIIGIIILIILLVKRNNNVNRDMKSCEGPAVQSNHYKALEILKVRLDAKDINFEEYNEKRQILGDGRLDDFNNSKLNYLKEQFARSEITTKEYIEQRNILSNSAN